MKSKSFFINFRLYFCLICSLSIFLACGDEGEIIQPSDSNGNGQPLATGISFAKDIEPIFDANCNILLCHGESPPSGLLLTSYDNFKKGGNSGPAFIPNNAADSLIVKKISQGGGMPPGGELPEEQVDKIKIWIDEGGENN